MYLQWTLNGDIDHLLFHVLPKLLVFLSTISVLSVSEQSHIYF